MATPTSEGPSGIPQQGEQANPPEARAHAMHSDEPPNASFKFTTFSKVEPIDFGRGMSSSDDEDERKPHGWYPQMSGEEEEEEKVKSPPQKKQRATTIGPRAVPLTRAGGTSSTAPGRSTQGGGVMGARASGARGVQWTAEEDTLTLNTWAAWPECTYDELTIIINAEYNNNRTSGGLRQRYAGTKKWLLAGLDLLTDKNAKSMGWARDDQNM